MPRDRRTGRPNGRPRQIPQPLRDLIWKLYHELLPHRRTRSIQDVALWLDEHDIPPPSGGWWNKSTIQTVLNSYRKERVISEDKEYDVLIEYERQATARAAEVNPARRLRTQAQKKPPAHEDGGLVDGSTRRTV